MSKIECPFCHEKEIPMALSRSGRDVEWDPCGSCQREMTPEAMTPILLELLRGKPRGKPAIRMYTRPGQATLAFRGLRKVIEAPLADSMTASEIQAAIHGLRAIKRKDIPVIVFTSRPDEIKERIAEARGENGGQGIRIQRGTL